MSALSKTTLMKDALVSSEIFSSLTVDHSLLKTLVPLDYPSRRRASNSQAKTKPDELWLPTEMKFEIIRHLDIKSLLAFRALGTAARELVDSLPEWKKIMQRTQTSNAIRLAVILGSAERITLPQLFAKICQTTCDTCGKLAPYLDVYNLARHCFDLGGECKYEPTPSSIEQKRLLRNKAWLKEGEFGCLVMPFLHRKSMKADFLIICFCCTYKGELCCGKTRTLCAQRMTMFPERAVFLDAIYTTTSIRHHYDEVHGGKREGPGITLAFEVSPW
ncbi:hypothetical protein C7974DRAFT_206202 [Boeremia exigua]|uniref:uncharacterized protein n=1 Tax=Boeremia exigua TaxID=749465 RepID=UPI001E8E22A2|nr:uncharacterized protein C7974DRAFT_206202 [Boeremia exigua]KAH6625715.1 hypothetical protein C7974DRAFT_206202 [Boeremia exigua]